MQLGEIGHGFSTFSAAPGGAGVGYSRAGFDVVGVDIRRQSDTLPFILDPNSAGPQLRSECRP